MARVLHRSQEPSSFTHMMWVAATALILCFASTPTLAEDAPTNITGAQTVDCQGVIELISTMPGLVIVDNRKQADFDSGHIEGAVRILDTDMTKEQMTSAVQSKTTPLLFYCNGVKCGRAANAVTKAVQWGYTNIYYYALGITDWKANQLPLVTK